MSLRLLLILCAVVSALSAQEVDSAAEQWSSKQGLLYFGVPVQVKFTPANPDLLKEVWGFLESIDGIFNDYRDDTEIGRINKSTDKTHALSPILREAFQTSIQLHALSDGRFDITVGPLRRLWKGAAKSGVFPTDESIKAAQALVGQRHFWLQGDDLHIHNTSISFDFGGMVKGLAVDHAMQRLRNAKVSAALVQVGGETGCFGKNFKGRLHRLGIPHPLQPHAMYAVVGDRGSGFSGCTSGNYRLPIIINGKPYYHIFDPRTGKPSKVRTLSVSVAIPQVGRNAMADGLSTVGVVMGAEEFIPLAEALQVEALVLSADEKGNVIEHKTAEWDSFVINN